MGQTVWVRTRVVDHHSGPLLIIADQVAVVVPLSRETHAKPQLLAQYPSTAHADLKRPAAVTTESRPANKLGKLKLVVLSRNAQEDRGRVPAAAPTESMGSQATVTEQAQSKQSWLVDWFATRRVGYIINGPVTMEPVEAEEPLRYMLVTVESLKTESA